MSDKKPNFVLVPDPEPEPSAEPQRSGVSLVERVLALAASAAALVPSARPLATAPSPEPDSGEITRPRLVFGFDATASREPAWETARTVTDALVRALPGALDVALAVHGGSRLHTFTAFTSDARTLRDHAAGITCQAGRTRLLAILSTALARPGVRVVTYIGDVYEESPSQGQKLADAMGARGMKLIVLHDTSHWSARRDYETFLDLARRTGGCVLPFDASAPDRLRDLLAAVAVFAVGGAELVHQERDRLPGAVMLLKHLRNDR
jgi:hypothetical protein